MNRKIPIDKYPEITSRYLSGKTSREVAKDYSISFTTVLKILRRCKIKIRPPNNIKKPCSTKRCLKCGKEYPNTIDYYPSGGSFYKDGTKRLTANCSSCQKKYNSDYHSNHRIVICSRKKQSYLDNIDDERESKREYNRKNKDKRKKYYLDNRDRILKRGKEWRIKNKLKIQKRMKLYRASHKQEQRDHDNERYKSDIGFKLRKTLSRRVRNVLKARGVRKNIGTLELIGCSIDFFKKYIESLFSPEMNWNNYGKNGWTIDHIIPCAAYDLTKPEEQKKCFHYTNLRPLWYPDNCSKNSFVDGIKITYKNRHNFVHKPSKNSPISS